MKRRLSHAPERRLALSWSSYAMRGPELWYGAQATWPDWENDQIVTT